ncbi:MAG: KGK domain-containing protein, partial [Oscillatoria sp. PMC 1076.18]|nr:KGK domain-containing protein [Oscillatoria sp. PMC 1076.18]
ILLKTSQVSIPMDQTEFHFINKCQIIRINSSLPGWQKGRLKTRIVIDFTKSSQTNTYLEFCPDKCEETSLLLDEIR